MNTPTPSSNLQMRRRSVLASALATGLAVCMPANLAYADVTTEPTEVSLDERRPDIANRSVALADYCQISDGCDITQGLQAALEDLRSTGGTLRLPSGNYAVRPRGWIQVPSKVAISGIAGRTKLTLKGDAGVFTMMFRFDGVNSVLENVDLDSGAMDYGYMLGVFASGVFVDGVRLTRSGAGADFDFSGIHVSLPEGDVDRLTINSCSISGMGYGIIISPQNCSVSDVLVKSTLFAHNVADDICLNSPSGSIRDIRIASCRFSNNASSESWCGFAVSLASVNSVAIEGSKFSGYGMNPVHVERGSAGISIKGCTFRRVATSKNADSFSSAIIILSGSKDVFVTGNSFDLTARQGESCCVYVGPGGFGEVDPSGVVVDGNSYRINTGQSLVANYGSGAVTCTSNTVL